MTGIRFKQDGVWFGEWVFFGYFAILVNLLGGWVAGTSLVLIEAITNGVSPTGSPNWNIAILAAMVAVLGLFAHELGHYFASKVSKVTWSHAPWSAGPWLACVHLNEEMWDSTPWPRMWIDLAGPVAGALVCSILLFVTTPLSGLTLWIGLALPMSHLANLIPLKLKNGAASDGYWVFCRTPWFGRLDKERA